MAKRSGNARKRRAAENDHGWFERKVAELKTELNKLPKDRQEDLLRKLKDRGEQ